jgi:hypothetical protein
MNIWGGWFKSISACIAVGIAASALLTYEAFLWAFVVVMSFLVWVGSDARRWPPGDKEFCTHLVELFLYSGLVLSFAKFAPGQIAALAAILGSRMTSFVSTAKNRIRILLVGIFLSGFQAILWKESFSGYPIFAALVYLGVTSGFTSLVQLKRNVRFASKYFGLTPYSSN